MMVFYIVFSILLQRGTPNFTGFLLVGITTWQWFARTVQNGSQSILQGKGFMLQVNIHKSFFPLVVVGRDAFKQLFVITLLLVFLLFYPTPVTVSWIVLPLLMAIQLILVSASAMLCAAIVPFLPDLFFVIQTGIHLMFFASGIFFDIDKVVQPEHRFLVYLNPMAGLIKNYRNILIHGQWPDWQYLAYLTFFSVLFFIIALKTISRFNHIYPRICQR
jgi:lipopolysaccharide transport system permease protein